MKIVSSDRSTLMEVKEVNVANGKISVTGVVMGAMPMKAFVNPADFRALLWSLGLRKLFALAWLTLRAKRA
jgi:hypothetical protein